MMYRHDERTVTIDLDRTITTKQALIALAIAAYRLAPPLPNEDGLDDDLGLSDAADHVRDAGITMLCVKDKAPMLSAEVLGRSPTKLTVRVAMARDDSADDLLCVTVSEVIEHLFGPVGRPAEDPGVAAAVFDFDPETDLCDEDIRSLAPPLRFSA